MAITAVGSMYAVNGTNQTTSNVTTHSIGNAVLLSIRIDSATVTPVSVSGGGCTWQALTGVRADTTGNHQNRWFLGTVTSLVTSGSIALTASAALTGIGVWYKLQEFMSPYGASAVWSKDGTQDALLNNATSTTLIYPTLTAAATGELYVGSAYPTGTASAGTTSGFVYQVDGQGNPYVYNLNLSAGSVSASQPMTSGTADSFAVLVQVTGTLVPFIAVGTLQQQEAVGSSTLAITPATVGNAVLLHVQVGSATVYVTNISGGGCSWQSVSKKWVSGSHFEWWLGIVTTAGAATITATYSGSVTGLSTYLLAQEFSPGLPGGIWSKDGTQDGQIDNATSTTITYPTLTATATGELYIVYAYDAGTSTSGSSPGFVYQTDANGNSFAYNVNVAAGSISGTCATSSGDSHANAVLIRVSPQPAGRFTA